MCGISVIVNSPSGAARVDRMVGALAHRGPDAHGAVRLDGCDIGHARLSIIDLTTGAQPMSDAAGRYTITFNGEIYNFASIRAELEKSGIVFRTRSDTEVVVAAYHRWGADCLHRFRGMFAFAIWDSRDRVLFAARDPFGEKPLYYASPSEAQLVVASEIKALLAAGDVDTTLDPESVDAYLAFAYVPPSRSIYRGIRPLPPAHFLIWRDGRVSVQRYWQPVLAPRDISLEEAAGTLRQLLVQSVQRQMVADVPVGAFLSGGLDSASIVALMRAGTGQRIKTFSVAFGTEINELPYARAVAQKYGTEHHEIDLGAPAVGPLLELMADVYDEPLADSSAIPTFLIARFARQHVKVVLSGDGGDEVLGGYVWYQLLAESERVAGSRLEWMVLRVISRALRERHRALYRRSVAVGLRARWDDMWLRAAMYQVYLSARRRRMLWATAQGAPFSVETGDVAGTEISGLNRAFYFDLTSYLPGDILVKVDRAAMANSLETRAPFLDRDLVEFAMTLPARLKVDAERSKIVLRAACEQDWPPEVRTRAKHGFGAPYMRWLQAADVQALVARVFRKDGPLRALLPGIRSAEPAPSYETWILLVLGLFLEKRARVA